MQVASNSIKVYSKFGVGRGPPDANRDSFFPAMISNHKNKGGLKMAANLLSSVSISDPPTEAGNGRGPPS